VSLNFTSNLAWWLIRVPFSVAYLWSCLTIAVVFYGLDRLDSDGDWILVRISVNNSTLHAFPTGG
jgi:hypothetical protein